MLENEPIRVAHVIGMAVDGGTEAFVMNYYKYIDKTKIQFDFFVESTSKIINRELIEKLGGKIIIIPSYKNIFRYIKTLTQLFKDGNYSIVHSHMNSLSVFTLLAAKRARVKVRIAHSHSTSNKSVEKKKNLIKNLLRPFSKIYATHYFACSELSGRWLFGNKTFNNGNVKIINNAIEINKFSFDQIKRDIIRDKFNINDKFVIGHVGRFVEQKNHKFLLDLFYEYQKINEKAILLLIGDGPLKDEIYNRVENYEIKDKVIFIGTQEDISMYYNAMDCFIFPSLYEGLGIVVLEAQINGLYCLVSSSVPKSTKLNDNIEYIEGYKIINWLKKIEYKQRSISNKNYFTFNIKNQAPILANIYKGSGNKNEKDC